MAGCCNDVQDLLTSVNDPDKHIRIVYVGRSDAIWRSFGCYVCKCCVPLLEGGRIGEAHHVYFGEIRMRVIRMRMRATCHKKMCITCHQEMCATYHQGEGSLQ